MVWGQKSFSLMPESNPQFNAKFAYEKLSLVSILFLRIKFSGHLEMSVTDIVKWREEICNYFGF
jgi:hypothetical protein